MFATSLKIGMAEMLCANYTTTTYTTITRSIIVIILLLLIRQRAILSLRRRREKCLRSRDSIPHRSAYYFTYRAPGICKNVHKSYEVLLSLLKLSQVLRTVAV